MPAFHLTSGETLYLALALGSLALFTATLTWVRLDYARHRATARQATRPAPRGDLAPAE